MKCDENIFNFCTAGDWLIWQLLWAADLELFLCWIRWWNKAKNVLSNNQVKLEWRKQKQRAIERHKVVSGKIIEVICLLFVPECWMSEMVMSGLGNSQLQPSGSWSDLDKLIEILEQDKIPATFTFTKSPSVGNYSTRGSQSIDDWVPIKEPAYDWGTHRKTHELVAGFVTGLMMVFNMKVPEHQIHQFVDKRDNFICPPRSMKKEFMHFSWNLHFS